MEWCYVWFSAFFQFTSPSGVNLLVYINNTQQHYYVEHQDIIYILVVKRGFKEIFCLPQILMSVQKMLICVKMDSVWMSLVPTVANVRWDSLPPRTASRAKVSHRYFRFVFQIWIGCYKIKKQEVLEGPQPGRRLFSMCFTYK